MNSAITNLPENTAELKKIIATQAKQYEIHIKLLEEKIRFLQNKLFSKKSEKLRKDNNSEQISLFNEAEEDLEKSSQAEVEEIIIPTHARKKPGRKVLSDDLPRVEVIHDLSEEEKICECGCKKSRIGEEVCEKLDIIPAKIQVIRHIRYKYVCKGCEGIESEKSTVTIAPLPAQLIPKGIATAGLAAHVLVSKFVDALPFYRQEKLFARIKVELSRATMAGWAIQIAERCDPLLSLLYRELLSGPLINIDETPVQVLEEPGRPNTTKSYMWIFRGGLIDYPVLIYHYHPTRSGQVALDYLNGYKGYIQTDGFSGYDQLGKQPGVYLVGCWAHARRKFVEVINAAAHTSPKKEGGGKADIALNYIGRLYAIEKKAWEEKYSAEQIYRLRQEKSKPLLEEFNLWLNKVYPNIPPQGLLGKAIAYTLNQWDKLIRYLEDGRLKPDNNLAENAIRPFVVGRKNWLFSGNPRGAKASALLYSLIETAKANNLEPYRYLRFIFEKLPLANSEEDYKKLLPQFINREQVNLNLD